MVEHAYNKKYLIMETSKKIELLEDLFDLEPGTLNPAAVLDNLDEYDSMSKLSLIVMMDVECGKMLTGEQILKFNTIQDILDFMG